jgi:hypothetical protein
MCAQVLYALTAGVAGYVSALCYKVMGGANWVRNVLLTTALFCGPLLVIFAFLNTVAIVYRSTAALPFGTICIILVIWALITFPLTVLGGIAGKNSKVRRLCMHAAACIRARPAPPNLQHVRASLMGNALPSASAASIPLM